MSRSFAVAADVAPVSFLGFVGTSWRSWVRYGCAASLVMTFGVGAAGCDSGTPGGVVDVAPTCKQDADCASTAGMCELGVCSNGFCTYKEVPGCSGKPCTSNDECEDNNS